MLLGDIADRAIVYDRPSSDVHCAAIDRHRRIHKVSVRIQVTYAQLGNLAGGASHAVLVALRAGRCIKQWAKSRRWIVNFLKLCLVRGKRISRRFWYSIAGALRTGILGDGWGSKAGRGF